MLFLQHLKAKIIQNGIFTAGDTLFNTSCEVLSKISTEILKKYVVVRFIGEPGVVRLTI